MPKIRGIKPETWSDETFVELSPWARLLFIGMWNFTCDNGHLEDRSKQIKMRVLPADDVNCAELLRELEIAGRIIREEGYITIPTLTDHQRIDRRFFITCDKPGCAKPGAANPNPERGSRREHDEDTTSARRAHDVGSSCARGDGDGDGDGDLISSASADAERDFDEWYALYPRKRGKGQAAKAYRAARKKVDHTTLVAAIQQQTPTLTARGEEFVPYPATWLNGERWADEPPGAVVHQLRPGEESGVRYRSDGSVDESSLPPVEQSWMRRRPQ